MIERAIGLALTLMALSSTGGAGLLCGRAEAAAPPYRTQRPASRTLANGLHVLVLPDRRAGLVHVLVRVPAGVSAEPAGLEGVASFTAQMLLSGTITSDAEQLANTEDRLATTVSAVAGPEFATVGATFLTRDLAAGMSLISDAVTEPIFPESEFARMQRVALARLVQAHADIASTAQEQAWLAAMPGVPGSRPSLGTTATVRKLRREDVRAFHRDRYRPAGSALVIAGDIDADGAFALAEEWFGKWSGKTAAPPAAPPAQNASRVRLVDRPEFPACEVRVAYAVPGRSESDRTAREFGASVFERDVTARHPGWKASLQLLGPRGVWSIGATVPVDSAGATVRAMRAAISDFVTRPRPEAELRTAARLLRMLQPSGFETLAQRAQRWALADFAGEPADVYDALPDRAERFSPAEVRTAVARGLDLEHPVIAAVGPAAKVRPQLERFGTAEVVDFRALDEIAAPARAIAEASPAEQKQARDAIASALAAHGGADKLRDLRDISEEAEMALSIRGRPANGKMRQIRKDPDRLKLLTTIGSQNTVQVLNGRRAWVVLPGDSMIRMSDSSEVAAMRVAFRMDPVHLLRGAADTTSRLAWGGREQVGETDAERVDALYDDGSPRRLYLDAKTHRLIAVDLPDPLGRMLTPTRWTFGDYRLVQGVWWPFSTRRLLAGEPFMELTTATVRFNTGVRDEEFEPPSQVRGSSR